MERKAVISGKFTINTDTICEKNHHHLVLKKEHVLVPVKEHTQSLVHKQSWRVKECHFSVPQTKTVPLSYI